MGFPPATWGQCRLLAIGGLVASRRDPRDFRLQVLLRLLKPPAGFDRAGPQLVEVQLPLGALPLLVGGTLWRGGQLLSVHQTADVSRDSFHVGADAEFRHWTYRVRDVIRLPADFFERAAGGPSPIPDARTSMSIAFLGIRSKRTSIHVSQWELVRALHAWNTDLALALVRGPTGESLFEQLLWQPPDAVRDLESTPSLERVGRGHYRVRLRDNLEARRETALQAAIVCLSEAARHSVGLLRRSLAIPGTAARTPAVLLPFDGPVTIHGRFRVFRGNRILRELQSVAWPLPFDRLTVEGLSPEATSEVETAESAEPTHAPAHVGALTDARPVQAGRRRHIEMPSSAPLWNNLKCTFETVDERSVASGRPQYPGGIRPFGGLGAATAAKGTLLARGVTARVEVSPESPPTGELPVALDEAAPLLLRALQSKARKLDWSAVVVQPLPRLMLAADPRDARVVLQMEGRHLALVRVVLDDWQCVLVEMARLNDDPRHRHAIAAVAERRGRTLPSTSTIREVLMQRRGRIARGGLVRDDLVLHPIAHPILSGTKAEYGARLSVLLAVAVVRIWQRDARGDAQ